MVLQLIVSNWFQPSIKYPQRVDSYAVVPLIALSAVGEQSAYRLKSLGLWELMMS